MKEHLKWVLIITCGLLLYTMLMGIGLLIWDLIFSINPSGLIV